MGVLIAAVIGMYFVSAARVSRHKGGASRLPPEKGQGTAKKGQAPAIPVVAVHARRGNIGVYLNGLGSIIPLYTVTVTSRVDGELLQVLYREGDIVQKGDLLVQIDPRPFQVQLEQAEGQLMRDQAILDNARIDLKRFEILVAQKAAPEQQLATQRATVRQSEGTVKIDQGLIDSAKLNLVYTEITAPIAGRVGLRLVDPGNLVRAADTNGLLVITQIDPISAIFTIAEDALPQVLQKLRAGQTLRAYAYDRDLTTFLAQGTLSTVDNQIDPTTGTVRIRAQFENGSARLFPNEFVNVRLLVDEKRNVVLLQNAAIQRSSNKVFAYVVKADSTVTVRPITVGTTEGDDSEITSGLKPGELVVMTGVDRLQEGTPVKVQIAAQIAKPKPAARGKRP
jgi:multidrug efflux system membrane fusion protein